MSRKLEELGKFWPSSLVSRGRIRVDIARVQTLSRRTDRAQVGSDGLLVFFRLRGVPGIQKRNAGNKG
ncbi:hypothetical protein C8970_22845, partial [Salmonella enterica]|nr:hypothetical protein [Salmonella enterica]